MMNQFMSMVKSGHNPEQLMISLLEQRMKGTPMGDNLIKLAREGNGVEIEKIARNLASQRGIDFDKEFAAFKRQLGIN
jgi:hypothetical protein